MTRIVIGLVAGAALAGAVLYMAPHLAGPMGQPHSSESKSLLDTAIGG